MKYPAYLALLLGCALSLLAVDPAGSKVQSGRLSTATLLATQRISGKGAPDGMRFLFLVARKPEATGPFSVKETRDFLLAGKSYQEMTHAELGKQIEPGTVVDSAEAFFTKQPGARHLAPGDIKGAQILTVAIAGAKIPADASGEITLQVGYGTEVEPLTFRFVAPAARPGQPKS